MEAESQRSKGRDGAISALNTAIEALDLAKISNVTQAKAVFGSASILLTTIRDSMTNEPDYVELGLSCANVCRALDRGMNGREPDRLTQSMYGVINRLALTVADIQRKLVKWGKRNVVSRRFHVKSDRDTIATWRLDLDNILQVFNKELATITNVTSSITPHDAANTRTIASGVRNDAANTHTSASDIQRNASKSPQNTHGNNPVTHASAPGESLPPPPRNTYGTISDVRHDVAQTRKTVSEAHRDITNTQKMVSEIHRNTLKGRDGTDDQRMSTQSSTPGESPPPPSACFGRDELIEKIVELAVNSTPIALIGAGGIGKTSVALTVLHDDRIKKRFGDNRRFIRCDKFPPSCVHFLNRLSKAIGAGVENPEDLGPLRPYLSSREMSIVLDNAESILDPRGTDAPEIHAVVEELSQFKTVWLCITSRIITVPRHCKRPVIPTLTIEAACDIFYGIYGGDERSDIISNLLRRLDFHALSISLLATTAVHNVWDYDRLAKEWDTHRTQVLRTDYNESLAATIELSLASPTFRELGPDARDLLGVVAFFPQGINENNVKWLFPTISDGPKILDKFCALSLAHRAHGFITMLAPLRDYLRPKDPKSSSLLCATKGQYFMRMSVGINPNKPNFGESRWITSEDVNVEHLLDVFTTIDADSDRVWEACANFTRHLYWHKKRPVILKPKIEGLPDDHRSKPGCLFELSRLFATVGNWVECKRLLIHALKLQRERGNDRGVADVLEDLSGSNWQLYLIGEGIQQAKEALNISERLGDTVGQARGLKHLARLLCNDNQFEAAEEAGLRAINLFSEKGNQFDLCQSHVTLGYVYRTKREPKKAIHHFEAALGIASPFNWPDQLFWCRYYLAALFRDQCGFDDANTHIECAKSHADNSAYNLGAAKEMQAWIWYNQHRHEEARSETLHAIDVYEKIGATKRVEDCRKFLRNIERRLGAPVASGQ